MTAPNAQATALIEGEADVHQELHCSPNGEDLFFSDALRGVGQGHAQVFGELG